MGEENNLEIMDMESHFETNTQEFSHSILVMTALSRCSQNLSKEMCAGYWNEKIDKNGSVAKYYVNDTRKIFIGSVKILMYLLDGIEDEDLKEEVKEIKELKNKLKDLKEKYLMLEAKDWETCPKVIRDIRMQQGLRYRKGIFCSKLPYENEYILEMVEVYEEILVRLIKIAKEINSSADISA